MSGDALVLHSMVGQANNVLQLLINRPDRANAYNAALLGALDDALDDIERQPAISALIISGTGERAFCAGADRKELAARRMADGIDLPSRALFDRLAALPIATIACINGAAIGGGLELALACDMRVCSPEALFRLPEMRLDLTPAAGAMRRLPELVGMARAKEMILFQRTVDAREALAWGLVAHQGRDFRQHALACAEAVAMLDRTAIRLAKQVLTRAVDPLQRDLEAVSQALLYESKFQRLNT